MSNFEVVDLSAPTPRPQLELHYAEDWAALYVDGRIDRVGETYWVEERAFELAGVKTLQDDAFMRGQTSRDGVAQTLDEVNAWRKSRDAKRAHAAVLQEQARLLLVEAASIEREAMGR